jgi:hypothetical protein
MTAWRRAFIDTYRRSQPIAELDRKARKAKRRYLSTAEQADLELAQSASSWMGLAGIDSGFCYCPINYCSTCGQFGRGEWVEQHGRWRLPIRHTPRCTHNYDQQDGPYPGWSAVISAVEPRLVDRREEA